MEIEQVAEMARAVAALPQGHKDFFDGLVADERAKAAEAERIAKLRAMSDEDAIQFAIKQASDVFSPGELPERLLAALREAGFVRSDLALLHDARQRLEAVLRIIVDAHFIPDADGQLAGSDFPKINDLIMQAATSLSKVEAGRA